MGIDEMLTVPNTPPCSVHVASGDEESWTAPSNSAVEIIERRASEVPVAVTTAGLASRFRSRWRRPTLWFWGVAAIGSSLALLLVARRFEVVARKPATSAPNVPASAREPSERSSQPMVPAAFTTASARAPVAVSSIPLNESAATCASSPAASGTRCMSSKPLPPLAPGQRPPSLRTRGPTTPKFVPKRTETLRDGSRDYGI
jgi:hypothetical protein